MSAEYDRKLEQAKQIIQAHNNKATKQLEWTAILEKLEGIGVTTHDAMLEATWEDLESCGIPRVLARQVAGAFRFQEKGTCETIDSTKYISPNKVGGLSLTELFQNYDTSGERNSAVTNRLVTESKGKNCVVFNTDGTVNIAESAKLLRELKQGFEEQSSIMLNNAPVRVHKVGESPNQVFDENPLFPGTALRDGQICSRTGRSWSDVALKVRQILYLALTKTKEVANATIDDTHRLIDLAVQPDALEKVQSRYAQATLYLQECEQAGRVPSLKLKKTPNGMVDFAGLAKKPNDPFNNGGHKSY